MADSATSPPSVRPGLILKVLEDCDCDYCVQARRREDVLEARAEHEEQTRTGWTFNLEEREQAARRAEEREQIARWGWALGQIAGTARAPLTAPYTPHTVACWALGLPIRPEAQEALDRRWAEDSA
jgi:hypothetical protein